MNTNNIAVGAVLGASVLFLGACSGGSADPVASSDSEGEEIKLSINQTEDHPGFIALTSFADDVRADTDGRVNFQVYPNGVLGEQQESVQLVSNGSVGAASISGPQMVNVNDDFAVLDMPLVFDSEEHQMATINDPEITGELFDSLSDSNSLVVLGAYTQGARSLYNSRGPVVVPEDMDELKVRVQESETHIDMINAMGGTATPMAFSEVYTALQSGVIDGAENNAVSYFTQKHYEVAPFFSFTNHLIGSDFIVVNAELLDSMSEADRAVVNEDFLASVDTFVDIWDEQQADAIKQTEEAGAQFNEVDADAFRAVLQPVVDESLQTDSQRALYEAIRDQA
ncbi:TRAP transporter substrate-binding protein [Demequina aurantiaca]|uniref:TRAP transporter substrate-binding protein n=1 Tax=Demequina aurantiaca TaxID=676200 RepID=UPI003D32AE72